MKRLAIFVSGSGSNAENIAQYFGQSTSVCVDSIWCNNPKAFALQRAEKLDVPAFVFNREQFSKSNEIVEKLQEREIDLVVLAGFLWLIPTNLIRAFDIINIHPALLPKYGGKGMYGMNVHRAVIENGEKESGITIHRVDECYDEGEVLLQAKCNVEANDTPEDLVKKIHELEFEHYPKVIESLLK
ncbi:phosphoribosylglycinamide formyltransferase [Prolixibacteraceae bacterium JC049]|nr:phosphoribosylglycinamide formyltransferase [Prolixibacteraceae bacterium JC049]